MMKKIVGAAAAVAALLTVGLGSTQAATLFSDNFNNETYGTPAASLMNFTISGSIDVIGTGASGSGFTSLCGSGNGYCLDLDGTSSAGNSPASMLTSNMTFGPGTYTVSFDLGGNMRGDGSKTTTVQLGDTMRTYTLGSSDPLAMLTFTATVTGSAASLIFTQSGPSDNIGNILDNVAVSSVPLPASAPMFGAALVALGAVGYRLRRKAVAA